MYKLFIDTCSHDRLVSVINDDEVIYTISEQNDNNLSVRMLPMINDCINNSNIKPTDIKHIFVVNGPGSFTGIRVGITIAKTWAYSLKIPITEISELQLLAASIDEQSDYILSLIDARRNYYYAGLYDKELNNIFQDKHIYIDDLSKILPKDKEIIISSFDEVNLKHKIIRPIYNIIKVINKNKDNILISPHNCKPRYLKDTEAEENLLKKRENNDCKS